MDLWEIYSFSNKWIMDNLPPVTDYHHIYLQIDREKQYAADVEFYGDKDFDINNINDEYNDDYENYNYENIDYDYCSDNMSSSDSEYDDYEYI